MVRAVQSIDFSHSSRKAWSIMNNFTGRSRHSPRHCPVSGDVIAYQLVRKGDIIDQLVYYQIFQNYLKKLCIIDCTHF